MSNSAITIDNISTTDIFDVVRPPADAAEVDALLPLPLASFHILLALAEGDRHGYALIQDVAVNTGGALRLSPGTLYRSIQRMLEDGLLAEVRERPAPEDDDERRRYYRITPFGAAVARAEARRLAGLVKLARAAGLAPEKA
jgi:DNA-binding PadR family transcriptional regulator